MVLLELKYGFLKAIAKLIKIYLSFFKKRRFFYEATRKKSKKIAIKIFKKV